MPASLRFTPCRESSAEPQKEELRHRQWNADDIVRTTKLREYWQLRKQGDETHPKSRFQEGAR
jgi:hypothetical protein